MSININLLLHRGKASIVIKKFVYFSFVQRLSFESEINTNNSGSRQMPTSSFIFLLAHKQQIVTSDIFLSTNLCRAVARQFLVWQCLLVISHFYWNEQRTWRQIVSISQYVVPAGPLASCFLCICLVSSKKEHIHVEYIAIRGK